MPADPSDGSKAPRGHSQLSSRGSGRHVGNYILSKTIGEGTFGKVRLGVHILTGEKVAVKVLEKARIVDKGDIKRVTREIQILKHISHTHIVNLLEVIEKPRYIYLVTEFVGGGELFEFIVAHGRLHETQACHIFRQVILAVDACHALGVAHRDLKPENMLIDEDCNIKLIDFGLSNTYDKPDSLLRTACGSPCYAAPEMIAGKRYKGSLADLWSLGVCLFAMLCGFLPFEDPDTPTLYKKIMAGNYKCAENVSADAQDLIAGLLTTEPSKRFTVADVYAHPWFIARCPAPLKPPLSMQPAALRHPEEVQVDPQLLEEVEKLGLPRDHCEKCLKTRKRNNITATYSLLKQRLVRDKIAAASETSSAEIAAEWTSTDAWCASSEPFGQATAPTTLAPAASDSSPPTDGVQAPLPTGGHPNGSGCFGPDEASLYVETSPSTYQGRPAELPMLPLDPLRQSSPGQNSPTATPPMPKPMAPRPPSVPPAHGGSRRPSHRVRHAGAKVAQTARSSASPRGGRGENIDRCELGAGGHHTVPFQCQTYRPQTAASPRGRTSFVEVVPYGVPMPAPGSRATRPQSSNSSPRRQQQQYYYPSATASSKMQGLPYTQLHTSGAAPPSVGSSRRPHAANPHARPRTAASGAPGAGQVGAAGERVGAKTSRQSAVGGYNGVATMSHMSEMMPHDLVAEACRVLKDNRVHVTPKSAFVLKCERYSVDFDVEVVAIDQSQHRHVVRMQLVRGDPWLFRELCQRILPALRLS